MVPSRTLALIVAAAASLTLLGAALGNFASIRRLRQSLPGEIGINQEPDGRNAALEEKIETLQAGIDEELGRYAALNQQGFLELVESILGIFEGNGVSMSRLDIREREGTESLEVNGEGAIPDILRSLEELQETEVLIVVEALTLSEGRGLHEASVIVRPASIPDSLESEDLAAIVDPERENTGSPLDWARRLFGYEAPAAAPRPAIRESAPASPAEEEPPLPEWIAFIGRFGAENGNTEYAFRDERDGRIRLLSAGRNRRGWSLAEEGYGFVILEIEGRRYGVEVSR